MLLYHGIGEESDFSNASDAAYGVSPDDFAKQMTLLKHAGFQTVSLDTFKRFVRGEDVKLPPRPVLLTFDDGRADSWTGSDGILKQLGYNAVLFVDVGRVDDKVPEYLTWDELTTAQESGRWDLQVHSGRGHQYIQWGPSKEDTGAFYAYRKEGESFDDWRHRAFSDIEWGEGQLKDKTPDFRPLAFSPPYGNYGQDGTNDPDIPPTLLDWLKERFGIVFTQDRDAFAHPGDKQPLGRIDVSRSVTGGQLHAMLTR